MPWLLSGELRTALRSRFRAVMNKPIHHPMLQHVLVGARTRADGLTPASASRTPHFDLCVMIVEDNPVNQKFIQKVVAKLGCQWLAVANGRLAIDELARTRPDLILMDLHMPELDGLMATMKIRAGEAGEAARNIWIVALTADAREDQRERTLAAGANDYLTKPVRVPELTAALDRFIRERKS
jgi:CheY-like chemotaxis protein